MARKSLSAPKAAPVPQNTLQPNTLILDNGAHTIKAGFSPSGDAKPDLEADCHIIANTIARSQRDRRTYVGSELLDECWDFGELAFRRPVERGYVVNWEGEKAIWERSFLGSAKGGSADGRGVGGRKSGLACEAAETNLILTEAPGAPVALQRHADEMVFEEFGFGGLWRVIAPTLNAYAPSPFPSPTNTNITSDSGTPLECLLVVDIGHSHTTITPLYHGRPLHHSIRRLEIGGKTLTNRFKEVLSRTVEVQKEDWIVQEIKEDVGYIAPSSAAFNLDLDRAWKGGLKDPRELYTSVVIDYVLPDYENVKRGFARPHDPSISRKERALGLDGGPREHIVTIGNERFTVPELLFTPSDIGMQQEGLTGTILQSIYSLPKGLWQPFLANVLVVGGSSKFDGLMERLEAELRASMAEEFVVRVARAKDPIKNAWSGGARVAMNENVLREKVVTRQEYLENGDTWVRRRFAGKVGR